MKPYAKEFKPKTHGDHAHGSDCALCSLNYDKDLRGIKRKHFEVTMVKSKGRALAKQDSLDKIEQGIIDYFGLDASYEDNLNQGLWDLYNPLGIYEYLGNNAPADNELEEYQLGIYDHPIKGLCYFDQANEGENGCHIPITYLDKTLLRKL